MTDEQKRIKIAEWCGWEFQPLPPSANPEDRSGWYHKPSERLRKAPPDYLFDLNAMHDAQSLLSESQKVHYQEALSTLTRKNPHVSCWDLIHASARQRAEALLSVMSAWPVASDHWH